ncbi:hypothetical protein [Polaribacter sp. IC073]|uniref:hypothetical protein n=1 Tax=Polaribacter sp. IC073 TaxID=2508540 RepID=UPI0011BF571E|nr:hypothetical protein [Polaribacter sp. IC073]TXD47213.1 hypothetical protein ES045_11455 [Polaribacter sp. IC073]
MKKHIILLLLIFIGLLINACKKNKADTREEFTTPFSKQNTDDEMSKKIKTFLTTKFLTAADVRAIDNNQRKFQFYKVDLNNDGKEEIFIKLMTSYFCGSDGCTLLLLDNNLNLINRFSPTQTFYIDENIENDWNILITKTEGNWRKLVYKSGAYPSNPTLVEKINEKQRKNGQIIFDKKNNKAKTYTF